MADADHRGALNPDSIGAEMQRRAQIVARYVALQRPSAADDSRFASELGLSVDSLLRLSAAWRRYNHAAALQGARARPTFEDREAAVTAAEQPLDLSGVSPARRTETRRRVEIVGDFLKLQKPSHLDVERASAAAGMLPHRFKRMVKTWLLTRDPATIPGAVSPTSRARRKKPALSDIAEVAITDAMKELGLEVTSAALLARVRERCSELGCRAPGKELVNRRLLAARSLKGSGDNAIIVDHTAVALAMRFGGRAQLPVLSLIVHSPSKRVIAFHVSTAHPTAEVVEHLIQEATSLQSPHGAPMVVKLKAPKGEQWDELLSSLDASGVKVNIGGSRALAAGSLIQRLVGASLEDLRFKPGLTSRPTAPISRVPGAENPLSFEEAVDVISSRIARHNASAEEATFRLVPSA